MSETAMLEHLLFVLQERQIPLTRDDVQWAFESVKTKQEVVDWVEEYLNSPTLLTKDEHDLYQAIRRDARNNPSLESLQGLRPVHDADLQTAINSLERSTAAVEKQRKALKIQREALSALTVRDRGSNIQVKQSIQERRRRHAQESSQLNLAIEDVTASVTERITTTRRQTKTAASMLGSSASERLAKDDRALAALEELLPNILSVQADQSQTKSIEQWCRALIAFRASEIRSRIKCSYLEGLRDYGPASPVDVSPEKAVAEKSVLQEELETLDTEIASVAEMVVNCELRRPILGSIDRSRKCRQDIQQKWSDYVPSTLEHMALRLDVMSEHAQDVFSLSEAMNEISEALSAAVEDASIRTASSPIKHGGKTESPIKSKNLTFRAMANKDISEGATQLLQHLDVLSMGDKRQALTNLSTISIERQQKLRAQHDAAALSTLYNLVEAFGHSDTDVQSVMEALHSKSEYKTVALNDKPLDARLQNLESSIGEVGKKMGSLDPGRTPEDAAKRDAFVEKWRGS